MIVLFPLLSTIIVTRAGSINFVAGDKFHGKDQHFRAVYECFMDKYQCPNEWFFEVKYLLPQIFKFSCKSHICNDRTKFIIREVLQKLINDYPKLYRNLLAKYDPQNQYAAKLEKVLQLKRSQYNTPNADEPDFDEYDENYGT